jgi:hypothetical protein
VATTDYNAGPTSVVEGVAKATRKNFPGTTLNTDQWTLVQTGAGQTVAVAGGVLTVNMNTTINSETIIQSPESYSLPFRVQFHHSMAQRIANQEVYLEVVNQAGTTYQGWMFDGTTTTLAKTMHANQGVSLPASPSGTFTVAATAATTVIRELDCRIDSVDYSDRTTDSNGNSTSRQTRTRTTLDPDERYYVRMRFKNLGSAPASNTVNTIETVLIQDINDVAVEVTAGRGNNNGNRSVPVVVNNQPTVGIAGSQAITPQATTTGTACSIGFSSGVTNASAGVKGSAGKVFGGIVSNTGASAAWFNIYDIVTATVGTTVPKIQILVPAGQSRDFEQVLGANFATGIAMAATDTSGVLSAVAPATPLVASVFFI